MAHQVLATIEERIRKQAREQWAYTVRNAFGSLKAAIGQPNGNVPHVKTERHDEPCSIGSVLSWLEEAYAIAGAPAAEAAELEKFLQKADTAGVLQLRIAKLEEQERELRQRIAALAERED
jgi:hypothetical protein